MHQQTNMTKIMNVFVTELGYKVRETLGGLEVYDENDEFVCELGGTLNSYRMDPDDEDSNIDNDKLEADIEKALDVDNFLAYQREYC